MDVQGEDWFYHDVRYVHEKGLMKGTDNGHFSPNTNTTRSMIATLLWRLEGSPTWEHGMDFSDVKEGRWYTPAICWAASAGVVKGYADGSYGPDDIITREQLALMLYRYAKAPPAADDLSAFVDASAVSPWARDAMAWAVEQGILTGRGGGYLDPRGHATRAETAAMFARYVRWKT